MKLFATNARRFLFITIACSLLFAIFGAMVVYDFGLTLIDRDVTDALFHFTVARPVLWDATLSFTELGMPRPLTIVGYVVAIGWIVRREWWTALFATAGMLSCQRLSPFFKAQFERPRPFFEDSVFIWGNDSFPSGHAFGTAILYTMLAWLIWNLPIGLRIRQIATGLCFAFIAIMMLSRMMLGVHYLSDVLAGTCLGVGWVCLWLTITTFLRERKSANLT